MFESHDICVLVHHESNELNQWNTHRTEVPVCDYSCVSCISWFKTCPFLLPTRIGDFCDLVDHESNELNEWNSQVRRPWLRLFVRIRVIRGSKLAPSCFRHAWVISVSSLTTNQTNYTNEERKSQKSRSAIISCDSCISWFKTCLFVAQWVAWDSTTQNSV